MLPAWHCTLKKKKKKKSAQEIKLLLFYWGIIIVCVCKKGSFINPVNPHK